MKNTAATDTDAADVRRRLDDLLQAIRAMDVERVKNMYATEVTSFDVEPPLQHLGVEAKLHNWNGVFAAFKPPLGYEVRDLEVLVSGSLAVAHCLNRLSGTTKSGHDTGMWVRSTICLEKMDGRWMIVHDHVSVPLDVASGRGLVNLTP